MDERALNEKLENETILDDFGENSSSDELKEEPVFEMVDESFFKYFEDDFDEENFDQINIHTIDPPILDSFEKFKVESIKKDNIVQPFTEQKQQNDSPNTILQNNQNFDVSFKEDTPINIKETTKNQVSEDSSEQTIEQLRQVQNLDYENLKEKDNQKKSVDQQEELSSNLPLIDDINEVKEIILDRERWYSGDYINLLKSDFEKTNKNDIKIYPAMVASQNFDEILNQTQRYAFIPLNVHYENQNKSSVENHWVALIIDKENENIFYLDPAIKNDIPDCIKTLQEKFGYKNNIILNEIDFQSAEKGGKSELGLIHCGAYMFEIFEIFQKNIMEGKSIVDTDIISENEVSVVSVLSSIAPATGFKNIDKVGIEKIRKRHAEKIQRMLTRENDDRKKERIIEEKNVKKSHDNIKSIDKNSEENTLRDDIDIELKSWDTSILPNKDYILKAIEASEAKYFKQNSENIPLIDDENRTEIKLSKNLSFTQNNSDKIVIHLPTLDCFTHQNIVQKSLQFLFSAERMRGILLMPFLSENSIKINTSETASIPTVIDTGIANDTQPTLDNSESPLINYKTTDKKNQKYPKKIGNDEDNESNLLAPSKEKFDENIEKPDKNCNLPIYTTSALLIKDEKTRKNIIGVTTYFDTAKWITDKIWGTFLFSLVMHGTFNFYRYPAERDGATLLDVLGISSIVDTFCIDEIQFLCFLQTRDYEQVLISSLDQPFIWPLMISIPIGVGIINAILESRKVKSLASGDISKLQADLKNYETNLWRDVGGWIITAFIPDMVPVAILCCLDLLSIVEIKKTLEEIKNIIIWDGNIKNDERVALFRSLREFTWERHKITQLYAISTIASIINEIELENIEYLKTQGVDDETLKTLIYIKTECFRELRYLAKHYNLPHMEDEKSCYKPLMRYILANYLMWGLWRPQNHGFHIPFLIYNGVKLFSAILYIKTIIKGFMEIINRQIQKARCEAEGNIWKWMEYQQEYNCSVCGDLPVYYGSIFTIEDCFAAYLVVPRKLNDLLSFINISNNPARFGFNLSKIKILDLSAQTIILQNATEFSLFLTQLKPKLLNLEKVYLNVSNYYHNYDGSGDLLIDFIQNISVRVFVCKSISGHIISEKGFTQLAHIIPNLSLDYMDLTNSLDLNGKELIDFSFLRNSTINTLIFFW